LKNGQVSMDFVVIASVALLFAIFLFGLYAQRTDTTRIFITGTAAQRVADDVARGITRAWLAGNGSVAHAWVPDSLPNGEPFNLTVRGRQAVVVYPAGQGIRIASAAAITSNVTSASFTLVPGTGGRALNITNVNGTMVVAG